MPTKRQKMDQALNEIVVKYLRESGFKGSLPNFYREQNDKIDLITFTTDKYDGAFYIQIGCVPTGGVIDGKPIPLGKLSIRCLPPDLVHTLNVPKKNKYDFEYHPSWRGERVYRHAAKKALVAIRIEGEPWFASNSAQVDLKHRKVIFGPAKVISPEKFAQLCEYFYQETGIEMSPFMRKEFRTTGTKPEPNRFEIPQTAKSSTIKTGLSLEESIKVIKEKPTRFLPDVVPFAIDSQGNYVCFKVGDQPGIYFWDHEVAAQEGQPSMKSMYFLADQLYEFWRMLKPVDVQNDSEFESDN